MASQDNLEIILNEIYRHKEITLKKDLIEMAKPIREDLDLLDMLKTIIKKSTQFNGCISIDSEINSVRATSFLTNKEYEKIKEWLKK